MEAIDADFQSRFRSDMGIILFLIKHSRPEIANVFRELTKCIDSATLLACKEMSSYQVCTLYSVILFEN
jgi:hypothetical protein